jgi:hypothetical protein
VEDEMSDAGAEQKLAEQRAEYQQSVLLRGRRRSVLALVLAAIFAVGAWLWDLDFVFFSCAAGICLALLAYFDANGHLREVRRRSTKVLVPDFSRLDKRPTEPAGLEEPRGNPVG